MKGPAESSDQNIWRPSPQREGVYPSGRPVNYQGSQGWLDRIAFRTLTAAAVGAVVGAGVGIYKRQNPFQWLTSMGVNCSIITCTFCGFQELTREVRAADPDDWANCFLGGIASGGLLGRIHGGPTKAAPTAIVFAAVGTGIQIGALQLKEYRLQRYLASQSQANVTKLVTKAESTLGKTEPKSKSWLDFDFDLPEWFPIQKLDEEAEKKRALERERYRRSTIESLQAGTFRVEDHHRKEASS